MDASSLFDEAGASPRDRFMLMMIERVQALEGAVASLEADSLTDSMSVQLDTESLDVDALHLMFVGGHEHAAPDWAAFAARFAQAVGRRGVGLHLCEVVVEQVQPASARPSKGDFAGLGFMGMGSFGDAMHGFMERVTTKMFLTARLRSKQPVAAVERALVGALDAVGAVRAAGAWKPTEVSAVRASSRARDSGVASGPCWTWRADDDARDPAEPKHEDVLLTSAGRFALFLSAMARRIE